MSSSPRVLCFGEVLWDLLPHGRFLGGAPLNVAYHLTQLGCSGGFVSAVGRDELGTEALAAVARSGVGTGLIARHPALRTGVAEVTLDAQGHAKFHLPQPVAWDDIDVTAAVTGEAPEAIVFGTLALRSRENRTALTRLLDAFPAAWVVSDLNLRPPFDDLVPLQHWLGRARLLKLNEDEARRLCSRSATATDWEVMARELSGRHSGASVCITLGGDGAGLLDAGRWHSMPSPAVTVRDTIGAGDSFTAALITGLLLTRGQRDWNRILRNACALGSYVAGHDGAQPSHAGFRAEW